MKKINETPVFNGHHGAPCVQCLMPTIGTEARHMKKCIVTE